MPDPLDKLWEDYRLPFSEFDDISLARWLAQTLAQLEGRLWRASHPLVSAYRVAAAEANLRQIWLKRLATIPPLFPEAECCRAPLFLFFTRDVVTSGLLCEHCGAPAVEFSEIPKIMREHIERWAADYAEAHAIAHWDEDQQRSVPDYEEVFEEAAMKVELLLRQAALELLPPLLEYYPALIWEDQDECLDVQPKDILTRES